MCGLFLIWWKTQNSPLLVAASYTDAPYHLPAELEGEDTCLHGRMVLLQSHELKPGSLMQFQHSKSCVSLCQSNCNHVQQKLLLNESSADTCQNIKTFCNLHYFKGSGERLISLTLDASSMFVASSRSRDIKFRPTPAATISSSDGGTEFSVNA